MSWITDDWRLKLLAVGLAVLMLGAVAYSQNPQTSKTFSVPLNYRLPTNPGIIITNGPTTVPVTVKGPADTVATVTQSYVTAFADATHASPGQGVKLNVTASATITTLSSVQTNPQIAVNIDQLKTVEVPVEVVTHPAPGWTVTKAVPSCPPNPIPCKVHFSGPASWENGIRAIVNYGPPVNFTSQDSLNWPFALQNSNGVINLASTTFPLLGLDVATVGLHIEATQGLTSTTVPLVASAPANPPPPQYEVVGITISPVTVQLSGDPATLSHIQRIVLPAVDLSGATSTVKDSITIPYPDNVTGSAQTATVTYIIQKNPNVSPSP